MANTETNTEAKVSSWPTIELFFGHEINLIPNNLDYERGCNFYLEEIQRFLSGESPDAENVTANNVDTEGKEGGLVKLQRLCVDHPAKFGPDMEIEDSRESLHPHDAIIPSDAATGGTAYWLNLSGMVRLCWLMGTPEAKSLAEKAVEAQTLLDEVLLLGSEIQEYSDLSYRLVEEEPYITLREAETPSRSGLPRKPHRNHFGRRQPLKIHQDGYLVTVPKRR